MVRVVRGRPACLREYASKRIAGPDGVGVNVGKVVGRRDVHSSAVVVVGRTGDEDRAELDMVWQRRALFESVDADERFVRSWKGAHSGRLTCGWSRLAGGGGRSHCCRPCCCWAWRARCYLLARLLMPYH